MIKLVSIEIADPLSLEIQAGAKKLNISEAEFFSRAVHQYLAQIESREAYPTKEESFVVEQDEEPAPYRP